MKLLLIPSLLVCFLLSQSLLAQTNKIQVKKIEDKNFQSFLAQLDSCWFLTREKYIIKVCLVCNGSSNIAIPAENCSHNLYILTSNGTIPDTTNLFKVGVFWEPQFIKMEDIEGYTILTLKSFPYNKEERVYRVKIKFDKVIID
jgi:hypothetical protein